MHRELTDEELETYSRQIVLADIGYDGQLQLKNARVCLVGAGGLGSPVALKLVGMGIGFLRIVDRDIVSRSDLHRQYLYDVDPYSWTVWGCERVYCLKYRFLHADCLI